LYALTDIQYAHFGDMSQESVRVDIAKAPAVQALLGPANAGRWTTEFLSRENGGAYGEVIATVTSPADDKIDSAITNLLDALTKVKSALNAVPVTDELTTTERLNLETAKSGVSAQITTVTGGQKTIAAQKALNRNLIQTAETQVNAAKNSLANAQNQLDLSKAGYTPEQIKAQEAVVKQAEANIASQRAMVNQAYANSQRYQAEIDKTIMLAPIAGVITTIDAKVGEIIFPTTAAPKQAALVSIISDGNYKITSNIAEVDVSKVKTGDVARVTLDAYGNSVKFEAVVSEIDPAETIVESVPTYKTTLRFRDQDPRIKSGMTANLDIVTANKENVLIIPQRAVISHDGSRLVRILAMEEDGKTTAIHEVPVTTGIRGTEGQMEIIEGLKEGDVVITFEKK
ncbi:efflux RND transporter periplasmic adaptor subunit, partial [Candidatus Peregrinibacteria bacterium]|nr:efflux RND transporter periplasmic adaptor subunit [Candidatus Peregrinibacteria bacterium]